MPDNLPDLIEDATLAFCGEDHDAFRAAAARLAMPLIAAYEKLAAEIATLKPAANAWNALFATIGALADLDEKPDAPKDERLNDYIRAWAAKQQECEKLAAELATTKQDLANERAVRSRRELAVTRAIAKAKLYTHPGTNAGTHGVLSEMVSILEGKEG